ncbi:MAG: hypothetical protein HY000_34990 [Planctomycetes bacterium]|nr:hypothetical protein [Planctomycetota bacterium]
MLLNIVRTRYNDSPEFLALSSITTQFEVGKDISFGNEFGLGNARLAGKIAAADRPTVSLAPLQDEQFTRRFLSPIRLDTIYLFALNDRRMGWILRVVVQKANGLTNSPDVLPRETSPAGAFEWIAQTLGDMARQQQVEIAYEERIEPVSPAIDPQLIKGTDVVAAVEKGYQFRLADKGKTVALTQKKRELVLRFSPQVVGGQEVETITKLLSLKPGQLTYSIKPAIEGQLKPTPPLRKELIVNTRSVEEIFHFLSFGVEVPVKHIEKGLVRNQNGCSIPGSTAAGLLRIRSSKVRPHHAAVAVCYQGYWFSIEDADPVSKETFERLLELYNLEIRGGGVVGTPLLTLPVGR